MTRPRKYRVLKELFGVDMNQHKKTIPVMKAAQHNKLNITDILNLIKKEQFFTFERSKT